MKQIIVLLLLGLIACDQSSHPLWRWKLQSRCYADPVIDGRTLYIVSAAGEVIAGEPDHGKQTWAKRIPGSIVAAPAVSDRMLFVATQKGDVFALEKKSGKQVWRKQFSGEGVEAPLVLMNDQLLVPSDKGTLYALSVEDGKIRWSVAGNGKYNAGPILGDSLIFVGGWAGRFLGLSSDGTLRWEFAAQERITENALLHKNRVFVSTDNKFVYAFDAPSGKFLWRFQTSDPTNIVVIGNELIFGSESGLIVLRPEDGSLLRKINIHKRVNRVYSNGSDCLVIADRVYRVNPSSGKFSAIELPPGDSPFKLAWTPGVLVITNQLYSVLAVQQRDDATTQ